MSLQKKYRAKNNQIKDQCNHSLLIPKSRISNRLKINSIRSENRKGKIIWKKENLKNILDHINSENTTHNHLIVLPKYHGSNRISRIQLMYRKKS